MNIISRIVLLSALGLGACSLFQKVETAVVSTVKDCADKVTHSLTLKIENNVSAILICDNTDAESLPACVKDQLIALAKSAGWPAIDCALADIQGSASANAAESADNTENLRARRAQAALDWRAATDGGAGGAGGAR